ncbi:MAG: hypothetical protein H6625_13850 [Bdellovibrionaceae bacterium]|nr:hypothetical protein [Pseudobdellovibrionaceae bacterium]
MKLFVFIIMTFTYTFAFANDNDCDSTLSPLVSRALAYNLNTISPVNTDLNIKLIQDNASGGAVISFGSGGDILNLIISYPNAEEYHLVDILTGWGAGPGEIVFEVLRRLKHLAKNNLVSIKSKGFTNFVPSKRMEAPENLNEWSSRDTEAREHFAFPQDYWSKWGHPTMDDFDPRYLEPLEIDFVLEGDLQNIPRKVYLHPLDFENTDHILRLKQNIHFPLKGLFVTGVLVSDYLKSFILDLTPKGQFVFELFAQDTWVLDFLKKHGELKIQEPHSLDYKSEGVRYVIFQKNH